MKTRRQASEELTKLFARRAAARWMMSAASQRCRKMARASALAKVAEFNDFHSGERPSRRARLLKL